eukprot:364738-Chlamydomonas_euryale.AAC.4
MSVMRHGRTWVMRLHGAGALQPTKGLTAVVEMERGPLEGRDEPAAWSACVGQTQRQLRIAGFNQQGQAFEIRSTEGYLRQS